MEWPWKVTMDDDLSFLKTATAISDFMTDVIMKSKPVEKLFKLSRKYVNHPIGKIFRGLIFLVFISVSAILGLFVIVVGAVIDMMGYISYGVYYVFHSLFIKDWNEDDEY